MILVTALTNYAEVIFVILMLDTNIDDFTVYPLEKDIVVFFLYLFTTGLLSAAN